MQDVRKHLGGRLSGRTAQQRPPRWALGCHQTQLLAELRGTGELAPSGSRLEERGGGVPPCFHTISM